MKVVALRLLVTIAQTSKKDTLSTGPYRLSRLQEIVAPVSTANIMAPYNVPEQKTKQKHSHSIAIALASALLKKASNQAQTN
jgi:hypothetical protein